GGRTGWVIGDTLADDRLKDDSIETLRAALKSPTPERIFQVKRAFAAGLSIGEINSLSGIDPWFLSQMRDTHSAEEKYASMKILGVGDLRRMKRMGFSDRQLAK